MGLLFLLTGKDGIAKVIVPFDNARSVIRRFDVLSFSIVMQLHLPINLTKVSLLKLPFGSMIRIYSCNKVLFYN